MSASVLPVVDPARVVGVDVARALALLGMMATHLLPGRLGNQVPWPQQLAGGRASALFAVLAGVSIALVSGRERPVHGRTRYAVSVRLLVRASLVGLLGLVLGLVPTVIAVILAFYGVLFALSLPFLGMTSRALAAWAAVWVVVAPVVSHLVRPLLPPHRVGSPRPADLLAPGHLLSELLLVGYYPAAVWLAYLLAGMAVGRMSLRRKEVGVGLLLGGAALAFLATGTSRLLLARPGVLQTLASSYPDRLVRGDPGELELLLAHGLHGTTPTSSWWWLATVSPHSGTPFDLAQTIGSAVAVLGACLLVTRAAPAVWAATFGAGSMTLSLYSLHVLVMARGHWPDLEAPHNYGDQVILVLTVGAFFALVGVRGPLETVVANLSRAAAARLVRERRPAELPGAAPG